MRAVVARLLALLALVVLLLGGGACASEPFDVARVGVLVPLSGQQAADGQAQVEAARLAIEEWNAAGGVADVRLELAVYDEAQPDAARRLAADRRVALVVGPPAPALTIGADRPALVSLVRGDRPAAGGTVELAPTAEQSALIAAAAIAFNFGPVSVAVVAGNEPVEQAFARAFLRLGPSRGLRLRPEAQTLPADGNIVSLATQLRAPGIDLIVIAGKGLDAGPLWSEVRSREPRTRLALAPGAFDEGFRRTASGWLDGVVVLEPARHPEDAPTAEAFVASYSARYGRPPSIAAAHAYDATRLGLRALAAAAAAPAGERRAQTRAALAEETSFVGSLRTYALAGNASSSWTLALYRLDRAGASTFLGEAEVR